LERLIFVGPASNRKAYREDRMARRLIAAYFWLAICAGIAPAISAELLPPDRPLAEVVDHYLDIRLAEKNVTPTGLADDATILRRIMLDLVGRIPTVKELREYTASTDPAKREKLVDALLASDGYVRHQTEELQTLLIYPERNNMRPYLTEAVKQNRSWDQVFRDAMLVDGQASAPEGAHEFLRGLVSDTDKLTSEVSVRFFGVNVSCAKCHDHPLVTAWTQDHYYGMKSFFDRTFENNGAIGEREYGLVSFSTTKGEKRDAKLMFLTGEVLSEPEQKEPTDEEKKREKERLEELRKNKQPPPAAQYSRRKRIVEVGLAPGGREFFARSIANRLFARFYGYGLVMPLDQMHDENPPSHPELLTWLARDLSEHGYDLKRTMRGLVLSQAYARDSRWTSEDRPSPSLFAVAAVRPMTPQQLGASLKIAMLNPREISAEMQPDEFARRVEQTAQRGEGLGSQFEMPGDDFQVSVDEALFLSNSERADRDLFGGNGLVEHMTKLETDDERIDAACESILLRMPSDEERQAMREFLAARSDRRDEAAKQLAWSLATSTEFRFNY
jgi:hypothetical protein